MQHLPSPKSIDKCFREGWIVRHCHCLAFACALALELLPLIGFFIAMTLEQAKRLVASCTEEMNARYKKVVFDEWAIVSIAGGKPQVLAYSGPRKEGFLKNFSSDAKSLREGLLAKDCNVGDFDFARQSVGTGFESFLVLGNGVYLICNNTVQTMDGIAQDPRWLSAQVPFVELSDKVRADAVVA
jgi:hypothetical protein